MSTKVISFGLFVAVLASLVGGAFSTVAQADHNSRPGWLYCTPSTQTTSSGERVTLEAYYDNGGNYPQRELTWSALGGSPSTGEGDTFRTRFTTNSINETRVITVTDGWQTASCIVFVNGDSYPTPTPWPSELDCSPSSSNASSGDLVWFNATGGNNYGYDYSWSAPEGSPSYGNGSSFSTRFYNYTNSTRDYWVTVTSNAPYDWQTDSCRVRVAPQYYPTPTPTVAPSFSVDHSVKNLTRGGGSSTTVTARNGDRLEFTTRIEMRNRRGEDVHVRDWLPQYANYVYGSTTVNGVRYQDGIATGQSNDSLALGDLSANSTTTVRFEATVAGAPTVRLTNNVNVQVRHAAVQNRTSTISFTASPNATPTWTPYPTPYPTWTPQMTPSVGTGLSSTLAARNITRGQTGELATVNGRAGETIEFVLRVRSHSSGTIHNVWVTDYLPAGLVYVRNSTSLNGYLVGDGVTTTGLNIGTMTPGSEATVRFSATVDGLWVPASGQVSTSNTAQARGDGTGTASAKVKVTFGVAPANAYGVQTGPADSLFLALAIAAMATAAYAAYTRTGSFGRRMATVEIGRLSGSTPNFLR